MSALATIQSNHSPGNAGADTAVRSCGPDLSASEGALRRLPVAPMAPEQRILCVWFRSPEGRSWGAIGGGATVGAAIDFARESCPDETAWQVVGWSDLYGE